MIATKIKRAIATNIKPDILAKYSRTNSAPFKCLHCERTFPVFQGLMMHSRKAHAGQTSPVSVPPKRRGPGRPKTVDPLAGATFPDMPNLGGDLGAAANTVLPTRFNMHGNGNGNGHSERNRIDWNEEERALVVEQAVDDWMKNPTEGLTCPIIEKAMQTILPEGRWRHLYTQKTVTKEWAQIEARMREIIEKGQRPPEVKEHIREVVKPVNIAEVLSVAPTEELAGAFVARVVTHLLDLKTYYTTNNEQRRQASAVTVAVETKKAALEKGTRSIGEIEATMPHIQVVGLRGHQHAEMVEKFKHQPIIIHKSIDPSAPLDVSYIVQGCTHYLIETQTVNNEWRQLVIRSVGLEKRETLYGFNRITHRLTELVEAWEKKHPAVLAEWRLARSH